MTPNLRTDSDTHWMDCEDYRQTKLYAIFKMNKNTMKREMADKEYKALEEAQAAGLEKDHEKVLSICKGILREYPDSLLAVVLAAGALWESRRLSEAEEFCMRYLKLFPRCSMLSLCYFHVLLDGGKEDEARREAARYLSQKESSEYSVILKERDWEMVNGEVRNRAQKLPECD